MRHARFLKSKILWTLMIFCILSLSCLYIFQTNFEISERFLVKGYTNKISELSKENKTMEIGSAEASSLDKIAQLVEPLNFEKIDNIYYIRVLSTQAVAK